MIESNLKSLSEEFPRYGFKKLYELLRSRIGHYNHKRVHRIYCMLGLNLKRKPKKRLAPRTKLKLKQPVHKNECWSLDYMCDALKSGQRFRTANVIDDFNRECIGIHVAFSLPAVHITNWLDNIARWRGYPKQIRVDNGPENCAHHFIKWAKGHNIEVLYIQPGKPAQNGYVERFNRSYREAVLDMYLFDNLRQVQLLTDDWIEHYNNERPHEALGNVAPAHYDKQLNYAQHSVCAMR